VSSEKRSNALRPGLSLLGVVALIVGNMVGTSIYTLPANLAAAAGPLSIVAWALTGLGYWFVALVYARMGTLFPRSGGPYVYARAAFGDYAGFLAVWAYWFSATVGNAAIALGVTGYLKQLVPGVLGLPGIDCWLALALLWVLTLLNVLGLKWGARISIAILFLNVLPLLVIALCCAPSVVPAHYVPFAPEGWRSLPAAAALVVWAYSGIESAAVPAEEVLDASRTIRRGTLLGYALGTLVFLGTAAVITGVLPRAQLSQSEEPMALMALQGLGNGGAWAIRCAAILAGIGTLNGWILMAGRIPLSAAADGLFFPALARVHGRFATPAVALVVGSLVASVALLSNLSQGLLETFGFVVELTILTSLVAHFLAAAAQFKLARGERRARLVALCACAAILFFIAGCGAKAGLWSLVVLLAGTPLYFYWRGRARLSA
jgi:APA family basic amino acid/polyamine antiporter